MNRTRAAVALLVLSLAVTPSRAADVSGHRPGLRDQWQPQTEHDARLAQPVHLAILGRAAVPALELLSKQTGVSFAVAPENLNTVGERKLTIIAPGLDLKSIMVQLCEALQEVHWDIDGSSGQSAYLLHRNGSADETMAWLTRHDEEKRAAEQRAERVNRMGEAKRALQMSPAQLAALENTDPLLARSVRDPHARDLLEILLTLPPEQAEQFRETGHLEVSYSQAPERWQKAIARIADWYGPRWFGKDMPEEVRNWRDRLGHATISFTDNRVEHGWGVWLSLGIPTESGSGPAIHDVALQPKYCNLDEGQPCYTRLLVATGVPDEDTAFQVVMARDKEGFRTADAKREERHQRDWVEPTDPDLLQTIVIGDAEFGDFTQLQALVAGKTGLPIISDAFTLSAPYLPDEVRQGLPLWRLLYLIGEDDFRNEDVYLWQKRGKCLVFHRADWPALAKVEIPEWIFADCRARIADHKELTLDDLAEMAVIFESRHLPANALPEDLESTDLHVLSPSRWALLLYASLSSEQRREIASPEGLPFSHMTIAQRQQVIARALARPLPLTREQAEQASFHLIEATQASGQTRLSVTKLELHFPGVTDEAWVKTRRLTQ